MSALTVTSEANHLIHDLIQIPRCFSRLLACFALNITLFFRIILYYTDAQK